MKRTCKKGQLKFAKAERRLAVLAYAGFQHALAWLLVAIRQALPQMSLAASVAPLSSSATHQRRKRRLMAGMGAKQSAAAACLLTGLGLCSFSWAQTNDELCAALDIAENCPAFSTSDDSDAIWSLIEDSSATGGIALRSGIIDHNQRSCLGATLRRPVRVAFRWRVSSEKDVDILRYFDDGRPDIFRDFPENKRLSGDVAWRDASFEYPGSGSVDIEWCYTKDSLDDRGEDAGYLDRLRITQLSGGIIVSPSQVLLPEGGSTELTLSLDEPPQSNVTINLTVPTESAGDITASPAQVVLSPDQATMPITITASEDNNVEVRETHIVRAESPTAASTMITVMIPPDPLPQEQLCAALDISEEEGCPIFSTGDDSSAIWLATTEDSSATGGAALRSGMIGDNQRSCLRAELQRPARVAFRWRVSSEERFDRIHYIDDGQRNPARPSDATGDKFLSGNVAWRDASFDYPGSGPIDIEWCYIKDRTHSSGDDAGYLDRLRITQLSGSILVSPSQVALSEGSSATITLSLSKTPQSNVTVNLTVPAESADDITVSSTQVVLSPDRAAMPITITAKKDDNVEAEETYIVRAESESFAAARIIVITSPDPLPQERQEQLCEALDISEREDCPPLSTGNDSSAIWSATTDSGATGGTALRSGMIGDSQRSCLRATLQRPVRVAFRWRVSSEGRSDHLHYIDDGQRNPARPGLMTGDKFLSDEVAWRDASFDYPGSGPIDIEWCYIKDGRDNIGEDAGFLDQLRITELLGSLVVAPAQILLSEGGSTELTLSLDETPQSNVTVSLTAPTESTGDITVSSTQVVLSPGQPTMRIVITASKDDNVEARETHIVRAENPNVISTLITVITLPDPLPQDQLCAALDISEESCPMFSTSDDSSAIWSATTDSGATGGTALRSGITGDGQRSCLRATLPGPTLVAFRWRVSSQAGLDRIHYIDDGQRNPAPPAAATSDKFLSGEVAWRDASFRYLGRGSIGIEWCYIKNRAADSGEDAGYLDRLRITPLSDIAVTPSQVTLSEGSSATVALALDETPQSNVTVSLTVPTESLGDIAVSSTQVVLSPGQSTMQIVITASKDDNAEARETHVVRAQSPAAISTIITIITLPDPLPPQDQLCAALDITENCPIFSISDDSSAAWSVIADSGATGGTALRSGMIGDGQRSCLRATLQRPMRVAFRWRVSSQAGADYLRYIDDGQRSLTEPEGATTGLRFLSGEVASWRDASFNYLGSGSVDIEWCYIKNRAVDSGEDAGFLDRLRITELLGSLVVAPAQVTLSEGSSATFTLSLDETPQSNVTVSLTVPAESLGDIIISSTQVVLSSGQTTMPITIAANKDDNAEPRETHIVLAQSPVAVSTMITVITLPDPLPPQDQLCAALDIEEESCPIFSVSDDSSAVWSVIADSDAEGGMALRSGMIGDGQRSCLRAALEGPALVAFRWRVSSQAGADYLRYIDDGQRSLTEPYRAGGATTGLRFLSGGVAWRDASFEYPVSDTIELPSSNTINIEWCYIKDESGDSGEDAGFLDWLRIAPLSSSLNLKVRVYLEGALQ